MASALSPFLWQVGRGEQLAAVFARGSDIDQGDVSLAQLAQNVVTEGAYLGVRYPGMIVV